ncbi:hypothetical protein LWM68_05525 [Niabella sp. W65]|nr:hypothetical protein [Niabella sp. W65]MCH7362269.1 hypothetical protein [Niabella sp. W65]ULT46008.1 hypothetical protein KRR40_24140 [Niabella sp. I65]
MPDIHYSFCPVCQSDNLQHVFDVKDYTVSGKEFEVVHCNACTLRFTQDVPGQDDIGRYYKSEDYISHTNTSKGLINQLYQRVRVRTMKQKAAIVKRHTGLQKGRLLDIGCGTGTFCTRCRNRAGKLRG